MNVHGDDVLAVLRGAGFDPAGSEAVDYVRARGWKIDAEDLIRDGLASSRVLLVDRNGNVVGEGWGDGADEATQAAFADYLAAE